jgi:hypothetical protein
MMVNGHTNTLENQDNRMVLGLVRRGEAKRRSTESDRSGGDWTKMRRVMDNQIIGRGWGWTVENPKRGYIMT